MHYHQAFAHRLADLGFDTMFGVMGDGNMFVIDAFARSGRGRYISAAHEGAAVLMALGYSAVMGDAGLATITQGSLPNAASALAEGVRSRTPLLLICADVPMTDRHHLQRLDIAAYAATVGAGFELARSAQTLESDLSVALKRAYAERRPVVLAVSKDLQWLEVDPPLPPPERNVPSPETVPAPGSLDKAVGIVAASRRPLVLAGYGASSQRAASTLTQLAQRIGAPLATTLRGKGIFEGHPSHIGVCGTLATKASLEVIRQADCVLAFGASLNNLTTDEGQLFAGKALIQCDVDSGAFGTYIDPDVALQGDVSSTAEAIIEMLDEAEVQPTEFDSRCRMRDPAERMRRQGHSRPRQGFVPLEEALSQINDLVPRERTLVVDTGRFMFQTIRMLAASGPRSYVHTSNISHIGLSLPYAVGAAVGRPDRPTLVVTGDGGFMLGGLAEFNSAVRHGCDLIAVVMNDRAYGAERVVFDDLELDGGLSEFEWPSFAAVADALGGRGVSVRSTEDFARVRHAIGTRSSPVLVEIMLDVEDIPGYSWSPRK